MKVNDWSSVDSTYSDNERQIRAWLRQDKRLAWGLAVAIVTICLAAVACEAAPWWQFWRWFEVIPQIEKRHAIGSEG